MSNTPKTPADAGPFERRVRRLPQWMTAAPNQLQHQGITLKDAGKVLREFSRQLRLDGHPQFATHAKRIAESLECAAEGLTWAQAFELDLEPKEPARRWRE